MERETSLTLLRETYRRNKRAFELIEDFRESHPIKKKTSLEVK